MGDLASLTQLSVNSPTQGKFLVTRLENWSVKTEKKAETKTEVGNPDGSGVVFKPGGYTISFTIFEEQGSDTMLAAFQAMLASQEWFAITKQIVAGAREQYPACKVSSVDEDGDNEGSNKFTVELVAMTRKDL